LLNQFRTRTADVKLDEFENHDLRVISWIRARDHDLDDAEKMFRRSFEWRQKVDFYNLLKWDPPRNYDKAFPYEIPGCDKDGCPVIIVPLCEWDRLGRYELSNGGKDNLDKFGNQFASKIYTVIRSMSNPAENKMVTRYSVLVDLQGFSLRHLTSISILEALFEIFQRFERNFPETMKAAYVVNAPRLFAMLYPLVKQIISPKTASKIEVYDCNSVKWKQVLLDKIPSEQLPIYYGGILPDTLQDRILWAKQYSYNDYAAMSKMDKEQLNAMDSGNKFALNLAEDRHSRIR